MKIQKFWWAKDICTSRNSKISLNVFRWELRSFLADPLPPASIERLFTWFKIFPFNPWICINHSRGLLPSRVEPSIDPLASAENFSKTPLSKINASASPAAMRTARSSLSSRLDKYDIDLYICSITISLNNHTWAPTF